MGSGSRRARNPKDWARIGTMNSGTFHTGALDCGSLLPLWVAAARCQSARGRAQSKTWRTFATYGSWKGDLANRGKDVARGTDSRA